jgi:hypothetical protein
MAFGTSLAKNQGPPGKWLQLHQNRIFSNKFKYLSVLFSTLGRATKSPKIRQNKTD